jgi:serine phosphatase RsbU (regulator of sigma subunit)
MTPRGSALLLVDVAVAKAPKYAVRESGDSVEVVERPNGGLSIVMADGQRSGKSAKAISSIAVRKAISLLAEGVRDGAAARATHDYLRTERRGQVSAELTIISIDLETRTIVVSRNSQCPVLIADTAAEQGDGQLMCRSLDEPADVVGVHSRARPVITELPLAAGQTLVAFTDGVLHAGSRTGKQLDLHRCFDMLRPQLAGPAQQIADGLLAAAVAADDGRPGDDTTVVVVRIVDVPADDSLEIRRMTVTFPVPPI